jgi:3-polyprenyl-4-hydroxybenzoate decarboxylase
MPFQDFRDFLDALRKQGELFDVDRPIALKFEVAKALKKSAAIGGPAFVFKNNGTNFPLVGGVYNTRAKALIALESTEAKVVERILAGLSKRIPPVIVKDAPVLAGQARDVRAGAANPLALNDSSPPSRLRHVPSQQLTALAAAKDQDFKSFRLRHRLLPWLCRTLKRHDQV